LYSVLYYLVLSISYTNLVLQQARNVIGPKEVEESKTSATISCFLGNTLSAHNINSSIQTMDIRKIDGKTYVFTPADDAPAFLKAFFNCLTCSSLGASTLIQRVVEKDGKLDVYGHEAYLCDGKVPMSPCPCFVYCGFGPCAAEWHFEQVEGEPTKFSGKGSAFACQTCEPCTNHDGDFFIYDEDHDGSAEKPLKMTAGCNPLNPPCFAGMEVLKFYECSDRLGTPVTSTMER
jgi:hypothetical protein